MLPSEIKITCLILTYNEEHRIRTALTHALKWADEVIVVDKGSTDRTAEIAIQMGARVHQIPFSPQGHERYEDMVAPATHDWVWHFTPGEVPTPRVIYAARELVGDGVDLIRIPTKLWSFGVHDPRSPWGLGYQPRLYHKGRVRFTGVCHAPIEAAPNRIAHVEYCPPGFSAIKAAEAKPGKAGAEEIRTDPGLAADSNGTFVYHPTHATAASFIRSHADYAINEARRAEPDLVFAQAIHQSNAHDQAFASNPDLLCQQIAWKIYWLQTALHAAELQRGRDIPAEYRQLTEHALKSWAV